MKPTRDWAEGDDYYVAWDEPGLALAFTRMRETDAAIRCLVTPVTTDRRARLLAPVWTNLFTIADRERIAKAVHERIEGKDAPKLADWKDSVERAFGLVIDWRSRPEPLLDLVQCSAPEDAGYLVWPVLARNQVNLLLADQKSGKSYDALLLSVLVALDQETLVPSPWRQFGGGPVVYYDAETDWAVQRRRLERVSAGLGITQLPLDRIHYRRLRPPLADRLSMIRADLDRTRAALAVIDSLTFAAGGDLNSPEIAGPTMNAVGELGDGVTKLIITHHGKNDRKSGEQPSVFGSSLYEFKARNLWLLRRESEEGQPHIDQAWTHRYASDGPLVRGFGLRLAFNESNTAVQFRSLSASESSWVAKHAGTAEDKIRAALLETEFWKADTAALAKTTGLSDDTVRRVAAGMADIRQVGGTRGRGNSATWELYQTGKSASENGCGFSGADFSEAPGKTANKNRIPPPKGVGGLAATSGGLGHRGTDQGKTACGFSGDADFDERWPE